MHINILSQLKPYSEILFQNVDFLSTVPHRMYFLLPCICLFIVVVELFVCALACLCTQEFACMFERDDDGSIQFQVGQ